MNKDLRMPCAYLSSKTKRKTFAYQFAREDAFKKGSGPEDDLKGVLDLDGLMVLIQKLGRLEHQRFLFRMKVNVLCFTALADLRTQMSFILCGTKVTAFKLLPVYVQVILLVLFHDF